MDLNWQNWANKVQESEWRDKVPINKTWRVTPDGELSLLQAISRASAGDTVSVYPGNYDISSEVSDDQVIFLNNITLKGAYPEDLPRIRGEFRVTTYCELQNLYIEGRGTWPLLTVGSSDSTTPTVNIRNCHFLGDSEEYNTVHCVESNIYCENVIVQNNNKKVRSFFGNKTNLRIINSHLGWLDLSESTCEGDLLSLSRCWLNKTKCSVNSCQLCPGYESDVKLMLNDGSEVSIGGLYFHGGCTDDKCRIRNVNSSLTIGAVQDEFKDRIHVIEKGDYTTNLPEDLMLSDDDSGARRFDPEEETITTFLRELGEGETGIIPGGVYEAVTPIKGNLIGEGEVRFKGQVNISGHDVTVKNITFLQNERQNCLIVTNQSTLTCDNVVFKQNSEQYPTVFIQESQAYFRGCEFQPKELDFEKPQLGIFDRSEVSIEQSRAPYIGVEDSSKLLARDCTIDLLFVSDAYAHISGNYSQGRSYPQSRSLVSYKGSKIVVNHWDAAINPKPVYADLNSHIYIESFSHCDEESFLQHLFTGEGGLYFGNQPQESQETSPDPEPETEYEPTIPDPIVSRDDLIGLARAKAEIDAALAQEEKPSFLLFQGRPGTGKSTVAKLIATEIYGGAGNYYELPMASFLDYGVADVLDSLSGNVIELTDLEPLLNSDDPVGTLSALQNYASQRTGELTLILSGPQDEMARLAFFDSGLPNAIPFDDYNPIQMADMVALHLQDWELNKPVLVNVVAKHYVHLEKEEKRNGWTAREMALKILQLHAASASGAEPPHKIPDETLTQSL